MPVSDVRGAVERFPPGEPFTCALSDHWVFEWVDRATGTKR
jgi:hypothetical protein